MSNEYRRGLWVGAASVARPALPLLVLLAGCTFAMNQTNGPTGIASERAGRDVNATDTGNGAQTSKQTPTTRTDAQAAAGDSAIKALTPVPEIPVVVEKKAEAKVEETVKPVETKPE